MKDLVSVEEAIANGAESLLQQLMLRTMPLTMFLIRVSTTHSFLYCY